MGRNKKSTDLNVSNNSDVSSKARANKPTVQTDELNVSTNPDVPTQKDSSIDSNNVQTILDAIRESEIKLSNTLNDQITKLKDSLL